MCWSAKSSMIFFILGMIVNTVILSISIYEQKYNRIAFCTGWYFVLAMQLLEYFIWKEKKNTTVSFIAYCFNILQILIIYQSFMMVSEYYQVDWLCKFFASIFVLSYILICLRWTFQMNRNLKVSNSCPHLLYPWWNHWKGAIYLFFFISLFLLLARPFYWSIVILSIMLFLFVLSFIFYRPYVASLWCFFVVFLPIIAYALPF
jgi:hypothetical protein